MQLWCLLLLAGFLVALLTGVFRHYALARKMLDIPCDRSSHTNPTPRGGGIAVVLVFLAGLALFSAQGAVDYAGAVALVGAGVGVAVVGFLDDHRNIPARWRLLVHFAAASWALGWVGGLPPVEFWSRTVNLGWMGHILAAIYLVWLLNLYNFMDGIDGIAGVETVSAGLGAAALYLLRSPADEQWILPMLLALTTVGFLAWNWPPAKIFMGDTGSGFLGMTLGILSIKAAWSRPELLWSWAILLGIFVVDATVTLLRRVQRGEKPYQAHRSHAYQHAARRTGSHLPVTVAVGAINVLWLFPLALAVSEGWIAGIDGVLAAYVPLVWLAVRFEAGIDAS